jgi:hypothetical protein
MAMYWPRIESDDEDEETSAAAFKAGSPASPLSIPLPPTGDSRRRLSPSGAVAKCGAL